MSICYFCPTWQCHDIMERIFYHSLNSVSLLFIPVLTFSLRKKLWSFTFFPNKETKVWGKDWFFLILTLPRPLAAVHGVAKSRTRLSDWTELNRYWIVQSSEPFTMEPWSTVKNVWEMPTSGNSFNIWATERTPEKANDFESSVSELTD